MIYTKTLRGQTAFQSRSVPLTPRQRATFIMFNGKRQLSEVMSATAGLGVTPEDVSHLVALGLLEPAIEASQAFEAPGAAGVPAFINTIAHSPEVSSAGQASMPTLDAQVHFLKAYPIATRLTANLGLRGFRLNLAVEAAGDLDKLKELSVRIKEAVGPEKFLELERALYN